MKIAIITAGGAGMFCGSCMQDNTLVRALRLAGDDAVLVPTYTPIRVDEDDVSVDRVFMGGINVYLDSVIPGWKWLPGWMTRWLNRPSIIQRLAKLGNNTDASRLGSLTLDMLKGAAGPQRREIRDFVRYLCEEVRPDVIVFSNALLSGVLTELRPAFPGKILCLLQGDDVFLDELTPRWQPPVLNQLRQNCRDFDGFLTHSRYYRDHMAAMLHVSPGKFRQIPLTVDADSLSRQSLPPKSETSPTDPFTIGYFARICPEKGIQNLLSAAEKVLPEFENVKVVIAGFLPKQHVRWFRKLLSRAQSKAPGRILWLGSPAEREEKFDVIRSYNVLCVPTDYHEPKGLYVLEAALMGVPSLLPDHGAFPEIVEALGCGILYDPAGGTGLVKAMRQLILDGANTSGTLAETVKKQFGMSATAIPIQQAIADLVASASADSEDSERGQ